MTNQEILELMARFDASSLTSFKLHSKDADLEICLLYTSPSPRDCS